MQEALQIKTNILGERNLYVATLHEDLAYALYVYEYSRGNFNTACHYVEKAIDIMTKLAPSNKLMLASAKRVKALILEEIALDHMVTPGITFIPFSLILKLIFLSYIRRERLQGSTERFRRAASISIRALFGGIW